MFTASVLEHPVLETNERVLEHLKKNKGNPQTVEEISRELHLEENLVKVAIQEIQRKTDLCEMVGLYYFPQNRMRWSLAAFGLMIACTYTFCELIKYYHL